MGQAHQLGFELAGFGMPAGHPRGMLSGELDKRSGAGVRSGPGLSLGSCAQKHRLRLRGKCDSEEIAKCEEQ